MSGELDDLGALAAYLADIRGVLDSIRAAGGEDRERAETLSAPIAEIERFIVGATSKLKRQLDTHASRERNAAARIAHLNAILQGIRGVNRLIARERSPEVIVRRTVEILVEARGLASATIILDDPFGLRVGAAAGSPGPTARLSGLVAAATPPPCVLRAMAGETVTIRDPSTECPGCPAALTATVGHHAICVPLACEGRRFGALHAVLPQGVAGAPDEALLLAEVASDVALALHAIELEAQVGRTRESLQAVDELFNALVAASPTAIVTFDAEGRVTSWNQGAERLFGWKAGEVLGRVRPDDPHADGGDAQTLLKRLQAGDLVFPLETATRRKDGCEIELSLSAVALKTPDGAARGLMCVFEDVTARKRAERALRESAEQYRAEFEHASGGRCLSSPDGTILRVNPALAAMLLRDVDEMLGRRVEEFIHPDDLDYSRELGLALLSGERSSFRHEMRFLRADGSAVWTDLSVALHRGGDGAPVHFITGVTDLTARKLAEEESERRGARLEALTAVASALASARTLEAVAEIVPRAARALVDADGANFFVRDGDGARELAEQAMAALHKGMTRRAGGGPVRWVFEHRAQAAVEDVFHDPRVPRGEFHRTFIQSLVLTPVGRPEPGAVIGVYWASSHVATADELAILNALADSVSVAIQNVEAYAQLHRSEERYRRLIESLDDLVYAVDNQARITYVSGAVARYGYAAGEVLGRRFQEFAHPDDRAGLERAFGERLANDVGPYEFRIFDAAGKVRVVRSSGRRVFEDGRLVGLAGVLIDLTAQRSTEAQLRASQKMEAVGRLAGGVAHDFNNLLTVINSYARMAARGLEPDDRRRDELAEIQKAGERAAALTRQLLAFSRRQVLQPEVIDVNALVAGMEKMLTRLIGEDIRLRVLPATDAGRIRADSGQVEQVLMNLAVNARDAMPDGGELTIETANAELDDAFVIRHLGARTGKFVRLRVRDSGCGMDAATRERLFEPFFTTKPAGKGTGLGLATVYGIVKQSGGSIWVDSEPGRGATFDVYFPRVADEPKEAAAATPAVEAGTGAGTILFVEDDEAVRTLGERVLADEGYRLLVAATGGEALVLAERHRGAIDLVLTDVVMPGMSGKELGARLEPLLHGTPILYMSGYGHDTIAQHGVLGPGTLFLPKPFTPESLTARVREIMQQLR